MTLSSPNPSSLQPMTAGLGLRRALMDSLADLPEKSLDFMEVAPENWINLGGRLKKQFRQFSERYPIHLHGLSLNIGGVAPLDQDLLAAIKAFMAEHQCPIYTEHLSYCGDDGHLYDLMPIPFTEEAVKHVVARVKQVQDVLGQRIALENASYYCAPDQQMSESEFINAVLSEADCDLLLDVNNIYVNSINHRYDAEHFHWLKHPFVILNRRLYRSLAQEGNNSRNKTEIPASGKKRRTRTSNSLICAQNNIEMTQLLQYRQATLNNLLWIRVLHFFRNLL